MMKWTAINHNGYLCIASEWMKGELEPIEFRQVYETGLKVVDGMDDYSWLIGHPVIDEYNGTFYVCSSFYIQTNGKQFQEKKALKRPKWAKGYLYGEWKRYEVA